ncbi:VOC family protein [Paracraurococcus ruber]|uniref:Glyoxalase n=1 Tax=Paracraurococcus ruber TaxID=77675 RepID=A0ABS1CVC7_9PROT|nr:VOC family protein [Paracraurococcus ruber]MBK1658452.1 glyoxalase [Paracraurococcus ruber]TDG32123.1 glyoxalase/bleomycin resistance/dioxygenase family protein [Paracraurococcus ruber]
MQPPPPPAQQITFLYAEDLAASRRFYEAVLRLSVVQDQGRCAIYAAAPGGRAFLGVCQARGPRQAGDPRREGGVVLTLVSEAVEAWHAWLAAQGIACDGPPRRNEATGITHIFFRDPAGYLLEIQRFERPDWPAPAPPAPGG